MAFLFPFKRGSAGALSCEADPDGMQGRALDASNGGAGVLRLTDEVGAMKFAN